MVQPPFEPRFEFRSRSMPLTSTPGLKPTVHSPVIGTYRRTVVVDLGCRVAGCTAPCSTPAGVLTTGVIPSGHSLLTCTWTVRVPGGGGGSTSAHAAARTASVTHRAPVRSMAASCGPDGHAGDLFPRPSQPAAHGPRPVGHGVADNGPVGVELSAGGAGVGGDQAGAACLGVPRADV